jgi:hypothetical protein
LTEKVDPIFGELVTPPCLKGDEFKGCVYMEENRRRYTGDDKLPPCPLHVVHHHMDQSTPAADRQWVASCGIDLGVPMQDEMRKRAEDYRSFWARDPYSGKRLRVI